jgi:hypothetical protein
MALTDDLPINVYDMMIATAGESMAPSASFMKLMHRGMAKSYVHFSTPRAKGNHKIYGTPPTAMLWDDLIGSEWTVDIDPRLVKTIVIDSLSALEDREIMRISCMEDDCTWKQGQVAKWCNKYPKKGRKR